MKKEQLKQLEKEIKEYIEQCQIVTPYELVLESAKIQLNSPYYNTPCEDCMSICNEYMKEEPNWRIWWCSRNT